MAMVGVVTDSASDLPSELASANGIRVVPLKVRFGSEEFVDREELTTADFWERLRASKDFPSTAAPSAGDFEQAYRELLEQGAEAIVSVHLSSKLSATCQSAALGAKAFPDRRIEVVDSLGASAWCALMALTASQMASRGDGVDTILRAVLEMRVRSRLFGTVDTLEYLRRGGRIGGAQALLGTMLQVKPIVSLVDGVVEPAGRVRTRQRALQQLVDLTANAGRLERLVVLNGDAGDLDVFLDMLRPKVRVPDGDVWLLGPVIGTHAGPGVLGVVFVTAT